MVYWDHDDFIAKLCAATPDAWRRMYDVMITNYQHRRARIGRITMKPKA